ncbi:Phenylalanine--tRNA ligase beta subunit (Phenylalanyl-tRNA synthetase beta subunit) (PheRS) [Durusdinium trenchii]|uniref:Phenylalanine--tRNA ligase beta subunit (Phenylalanyl-tRNA synthetase beta subunit) (PheRS) n=1 Tax=Durusdinium trenchii TaxID=1381693 RepID=A0ABP0P7K4_9DINO
MGKKPKAKAEEPEKPPAEPAEPWLCGECEQENPAEELACIACEAPKPVSGDGKFEHFAVALVKTCEPVPGKDKLKKLEVDVGSEELLKIVTNASNVKEGSRVVVAKVGAIIDGEPLKKSVAGSPR